MAADLDLLVAGGVVVRPEGRERINVGVHAGRIAYLGPVMRPAAETVDATGLLVMPGGVDTHVHLMDPGSPEREDFPSGSSAAVASGVTTIIEHTHGQPIRTVDDLEAKRKHLTGRSEVDFALAAHAWPGATDRVEELWRAGIAFFKVFTCTTHGVPGHDPAALHAHLQAAAQEGAVTLIHCEDESLTASAERNLRESGQEDGSILPVWRNRNAEVTAAAVAALLVRRTGARAVVAHVSHPEVAEYVHRERSSGADLFAESCPQYFLLREEEVLTEGALRKFTPPARARTDGDEAEMWRLLREGKLTHISSDHAPSTRTQKADGGIWDVHFGLPGLDSTMAVLLDAAARGVLSFEDVTRVYSENPAKIYGLWPRKGRIGLGADADLILVDPTRQRILSDDTVLSKAGWSPFAGRAVTGAVVRTYLRGELVAEDGAPEGSRVGRFLVGAGGHRVR